MPAMPRDLPVWALAAASLRAGRPVVLLCVVYSTGSSPGRQGFKMCITPTATAGSIGGGIMEHKWVELGRQRLQAGDFSPLLRPQVHRREAPADRSGLMCSGEQHVLVWPLAPTDAARVTAIECALQTNAGGYVTVSPVTGLQILPLDKAVESETEAADFYAYQPGPAWCYRERLGFRNHLTIVGGGHVSLALSRVLALLDFELTVLDDRPDLPTLAANTAAHHRRLVDYENLAAEIPAGPHRSVVVMTVGYRTDAVVLRQLLGRHYHYLGVMGSAAKVAKLREELRAVGFPAGDIALLHGPIGVPIHSQTPEEIAVSIAAELIRARRERAALNPNAE
ncbi:MAG: XdhC/CoxI family protein [Hymenobacter sp.]